MTDTNYATSTASGSAGHDNPVGEIFGSSLAFVSVDLGQPGGDATDTQYQSTHTASQAGDATAPPADGSTQNNADSPPPSENLCRRIWRLLTSRRTRYARWRRSIAVEMAFNMLPFGIFFILFMAYNRPLVAIARIAGITEWAMAAIILCGQAIVTYSGLAPLASRIAPLVDPSKVRLWQTWPIFLIVPAAISLSLAVQTEQSQSFIPQERTQTFAVIAQLVSFFAAAGFYAHAHWQETRIREQIESLVPTPQQGTVLIEVG